MTNQREVSSTDADHFDETERLLSSYPELTKDELERLKRCLRAASAFEVASLATKHSTSDAYTQFRADHIEPFAWKDKIVMGLGVAALLGVLAFIGLSAT